MSDERESIERDAEMRAAWDAGIAAGRRASESQPSSFELIDVELHGGRFDGKRVRTTVFPDGKCAIPNDEPPTRGSHVTCVIYVDTGRVTDDGYRVFTCAKGLT